MNPKIVKINSILHTDSIKKCDCRIPLNEIIFITTTVWHPVGTQEIKLIPQFSQPPRDLILLPISKDSQCFDPLWLNPTSLTNFLLLPSSLPLLSSPSPEQIKLIYPMSQGYGDTV